MLTERKHLDRLALLGKHIKFHRLRQNLTQAELGRRVARTDANISRIESGTRDVQYTLLIALASALGVDAAALLRTGPPDLTREERTQP